MRRDPSPTFHAPPPTSTGRSGARRALGGLLVLLLLGGCSSHDDNLNAWLRQMKARKPPPIEPLKAPTVYAPVPYEPLEGRTPFEPMVLQAPERKVVDSGVTPDFNRPREPLESFPLTDLVLVGMVIREDGMVALIKAPSGEVVSVREGNHIGRNFGRIETMNQNQMTLREIVRDDAGQWQKRTTVFGFVDAGGG